MSLTNHPPGKDYSRSGPRRCRKCKGLINAFSSACFSCGEVWISGKHRSGQARYEPEPTTPAPAVALTFKDYDDEPLGGAA